MRFLTVVAAGLLTLSLGACKKNIQTNEAVRDAIVKHLAARTDLSVSNMNIEVSNVSFSENKAVAMVGITPKGGDPAAGMKMEYTLEQKGDSWEVKSKSSGGMGGHGGAMPGAGGAGTPPRELPADHPPMGAPTK